MLRRKAFPAIAIAAWACVALLLWGTVAGCQTRRTVLIKADGYSRLVPIERAETVGDALTEAGITLGPRDKVSPDIYTPLPRSGTITVIRVTERLESVRLPIPFEQEILRDESLPRGQTRLVRLGVAGERQRTYRITYEDGQEVRREVAADQVLREPVNEVILAGTKGRLESVAISGTIAYLSGGNAWIMRTNSANKRPITFSGDLDQRVFALSGDGRWLAFSRQAFGEGGLNTLWLLNTTIVGESPEPLRIADVLYAEWQGNGLLYSTAQATPGPPGWKANNDLWLWPGPGLTPRALTLPIPPGLYAWWGREYALSPNGRLLAYAAPDTVGVVDLRSGEHRALAHFPVVHTYGDWVWTPGLTWSPDGRFLAAVLHGPPVRGEAPEDSPIFDLWLLAADGSKKELLVPNVGMWALPVWSPGGAYLAYGVSQEPGHSQQSRYELWILRLNDGQARRLLPIPGWTGLLPQRVAWSPKDDALVVSYLGDLYLIGLDGSLPKALTDDGRSSLPRWR